MGLFSRHKYKTLSHAVLAGDLRAARRMLDQGVDPNMCDPDDDAYPIHYVINHGPEMVQLLVDHGADVNIPARETMPLAAAEARGYMVVASILRRAGARVRSDNEEFSMDPRLQIEPKISMLVVMAHINFPTESPERIADRVEGKHNLEFPKNMPLKEQERIRKDVRALIMKECGVKDYLASEKKPVPLTTRSYEQDRHVRRRVDTPLYGASDSVGQESVQGHARTVSSRCRTKVP